MALAELLAISSRSGRDAAADRLTAGNSAALMFPIEEI
jgi:hypothetical protein